MRRDTSEVAPDRDRSDAPSGSVGYGLLIQYRILAFTTATLLIILVFVGIPLQVAAHSRGVVNVVGTLHGFLYLAYLVVAFRLTYKLKEPIWKMALILLAGTVPFCAFIAERKVTRHFNTLTGRSPRGAVLRSAETGTGRAQVLRKRWLSPRALLLHLEVAVVAPGCVVAGWWQATRALAGNGLSWVYSVEWPLFALLAIWGWWHLIHEDPESYRRRRLRSSDSGWTEASSADVDAPMETDAAFDPPVTGTAPTTRRDSEAIRSARILAMLICAEFVLGFVALAFVPFGRRSGWFPPKGEAIYLVHAIFGAVLVIGATMLLIRSRDCRRAIKLSGRFGFAGLLLAAGGGLLVADQSLIRFLGMTLMLIGGALSVFGYMIPRLHSSTRDLRMAMVGTDPRYAGPSGRAE